MARKNTWQALRLGAAVFWTLLLVWGLSAPASQVSRFPLRLWDKAVHFGLFLFYGLLWLAAVGHRPTRLAAVGLLGVLLAGGTEWYQQTATEGRQGSLGDFGANLAGLACALLVYFLAARLIRRQESRSSRGRVQTTASGP